MTAQANRRGAACAGLCPVVLLMTLLCVSDARSQLILPQATLPSDFDEVPPPPPRADGGAEPIEAVPDDEVPRDPTVPSAEILDRLQPRQPEVPGVAPARPAFNPLPVLPEIQLRAIVLSSAVSGTALLVADSRQVTVRLGRVADKRSINFPPRQFWQHEETLDQIDDVVSEGRVASSSEELPAPTASRSIDLNGFSLGGMFFSVEDFSDRAILLRVHPHDQFLLVH